MQQHSDGQMYGPDNATGVGGRGGSEPRRPEQKNSAFAREMDLLWRQAGSGDGSRAAGALPGRLRWLESAVGREADTRADAGVGRAMLRRETQPTHNQANGMAENLPALLHDTRNMVAALDLYCDLLAEPGVLGLSFRHYAHELRLVAGASRSLMEKLTVLDASRTWEARIGETAQPPSLSRFGRGQELLTSQPIESVAEELLVNHSLLSALVGPAVTVGLTLSGGYRPIAMSPDDLTRVLVNLARNAAEVMPAGGHIQVALEECPSHLTLTFSDNGPGIPKAALETIFSPGYSSHVSLSRPDYPEADLEASPEASPEAGRDTWPVRHRGLGLSIVRTLVSAAGGTIWATNQQDCPAATTSASDCTGAVFVLEFPVASSPIS